MSAFDTELAAQAESESVSQAEAYTSLYGQYATAERIRPFAEENMLATAYFEHLTEINKPGDEEVQEYYEANKNNYDKVDYRSCLLYTSHGAHGIGTWKQRRNDAGNGAGYYRRSCGVHITYAAADANYLPAHP